MKQFDIAILVEGKYVDPKEVDWYVEQVLLEDSILIDELKEVGFNAEKVDWSSIEDLSKYKAVIFSSVWDYFTRFKEFKTFLDRFNGQSVFINPIETIQWNMDKHYMADLQNNGIRIVPSYFIEKGDQRTLKQILEERDWKETVIKPCISGAARHTYKLDPDNLESVEPIFKELIQNEAMILQPFMKNITTKGEVSHVVIGGKYAHSVLKKAKTGDYRVQDDFGGSVHQYSPNKEEIAFAESSVKACETLPHYARVDVVWDNEDQLALGELELIEPELWFRNNPAAAKMLATEVAKLLNLGE